MYIELKFVCILFSLQARERRSGGRGRGGGGGEEGEEDVSGLKRELDSSLKELKKLKERKWSLERECVIYQSQLEVRVKQGQPECRK